MMVLMPPRNLITRIAPSPTGLFHMGTARTLYFNWLAARATDGKFIVRIDDTDTERNRPEYTDLIYRSIDWLRLNYDITVKQSDRLDLYHDTAEKLIANGYAYRHEDKTVRLKDRSYFPGHPWHDLISDHVEYGGTPQDLAIIHDMILVKSSGMPVYHFASVVDDISYGIDLIIRGTDHISNTTRQIVLWQAVCYSIGAKINIPEFAHVGLIHLGGKKLSKRDNAASIEAYSHIDPMAMQNFLLRLGWSPKDPNFDRHTPLIPNNLAVEMFFTAGNMRNVSATVDMAKLAWYDRKYRARYSGKVIPT